MEDRLKAIEDLKLYTLTDLEPFFGVTHQTLLKYVKQGKLKGKKINGKWRFTREDIELFNRENAK